MLIKNLVKKLEKNGAVKISGNEDNEILTYKFNNTTVQIFSNPDSKDCLFTVVQSAYDRETEDFMTDYHTGVYCHTIKETLQYMLSK